jgi:hypothetical protein
VIPLLATSLYAFFFKRLEAGNTMRIEAKL